MTPVSKVEDSIQFWLQKANHFKIKIEQNLDRVYKRPWAEPSKINNKHDARISKLKSKRLQLDYSETMTELNQKKAFLSSFRNSLNEPNKAALIQEIKSMQLKVM